MSSAGRKNSAKVEDLEAATRAYAAGAKIGRFCTEYPGIPERTFRHRANLLKTAWRYESLGRHQYRGGGMEGDLLDFVVGMQKNGLPLNRETVMAKANDIYRVRCEAEHRSF